MTINLRSVPAFKNISESNLQNLLENSEFLNYTIGSPLLRKNIVPNKILLILSGEARLLEEDINQNLNTISKLATDNFIGLASLLKGIGCEYITASTDIIGLSIPDKIILKLYNEEEFFKNWCDTKTQAAESLELLKYINRISNNPYEDIKEKFDIISNNFKINVINNNNNLQINQEYIYISGSANIIDNNIGDIISSDQTICTRGVLPARIYQIKKSIFEKISKQIENESSKENPIQTDFKKININDGEGVPKQTVEEIGRKDSNEKFKIIKANGVLRESQACLQMLSSNLNLPYRRDTIEKILRDKISSDKKPTLQLIGGITSMMGLHSTIVKIDPKQANRIPHNSLIKWNNSFAIVKENHSNCLEIISPSQGIIILDSEKVNESFKEGFIELLLVDKSDQTPNKKFGLEWLWPSINRYRGVLLQVLLASAVVQLFGLANPLMIQIIIDKVISQRSLDTLQILGIALVFVTILGSLISSLRTYLFTETTNRIDTRLGAEVIDHLLRLPLNYFDQRPVGELGSRIAELEKIRNFLTGQALTTLLDSIFSVIYIVIMFIYSWLLSIIALIVVPIQILITFIGTPLIRRQIREIAQENAKTQSHLVEVLTGVQTVKAQNVENISRWKWQELYSKYISKTFQKTITTTVLSESSQALQQLSQLLVLWVGAGLVLKGELSLGQLIAFRIISGFVTQPLLRLSTIWQNIQELRVSFERLADIIDTPIEASVSEREKIPLPSIKGSVKFEDVSFSFNRNIPNVLTNVNLNIKPGQFVGVVGQSGSGKSTLMKLLPRLYKPNSGKISIDNYDIDKVELYSLRRQIGIVPQEPLLFAGTINDNIALTDPEATSDEIVKAAKIANAHEFIMTLSEGYSTNVGERGAGLSGGQKQRIAIARTLLSNPKLLILDEATSALDYATERTVCEGIRKACKDSTAFFITHRLSTVKNADLIIMLHQGSIVETGTHRELIDLKGRYYSLYRQQEST